jgi:hypothetical protein
MQSLVAWPVMPGQLATALRPRLGPMAEEMISEIELRTGSAGAAHRAMTRLAVEVALTQFVDLIADPASPWTPTLDLFREVGRRAGQAADSGDGPGLEGLQTALRLGARVAWRMLTEEADRLAVSREELGMLAEAVFAFLDEVAAAATQGYNQAREALRACAEVAEELEHRRLRLLDLLLSDPAPSPQAIAELAQAAQWRVPRTVAAVALADREPTRCAGFDPGILVDLGRRDPCLLVPDPGPGPVDALDGWTAAVGPAVPCAEAAKSLRWARETLALARRGVIPDRGVVRAADHLPTLVIFKDEELVRTVAAGTLAPLWSVRPRHRERLARTLLACLESGFNATEVAGRLEVHPQTVRYRLHQLEELFGAKLHDPRIRLEFEIVLHAWLSRPEDRAGLP